METNKEKSYYEIFRERVREGALKLSKAPTEVPENILWLKFMVIERIEKIDKCLSNEVNTFRVLDGKEVSLTHAMAAEKEGKSYKFGFTEQYVNLLMHYAYEAGKKSRDDDFQRATGKMNKALESIAEILEDAGYINNESGW